MDFKIILKRTKSGTDILIEGGRGDKNSLADALAELYGLGIEEGDELEIGARSYDLKGSPATQPMLNYLWGHLAVVLLRFLRSTGERVKSKELAVQAFKSPSHFCWTSLIERGKATIVDLSLNDRFTSEQEKALFVEHLKMFLLTNGCRIQTPDEFKKRKKCQQEP